jgi:hypothetical protein
VDTSRPGRVRRRSVSKMAVPRPATVNDEGEGP